MILKIYMGMMYLTGFLVVCAIALFVIVQMVEALMEYLDRWRTLRSEMFMLRRLGDIELWCAYEYPIVKVFTEELRYCINHGVGLDYDKFRDRLRKEFPLKPPAPEEK